MPPPMKLAVNCYTARCGQVKMITSDRDNTIRMWYRLHQKKCSTCKDVPFKNKGDKHILTKDKETLRIKDTFAGNPAGLEFSRIEAFTKVKDKMAPAFKELVAEITKRRRDGSIRDPVIREQYREEYVKMYNEFVETIMKE